MTLTSPFIALTSHLWGSLWALSPLCWPLNPSCSNQWLCDMCHSLIGYKEAQSMCSPLIQSEPSLAFSSFLHLSPPSFKPLAYKLNPLPSHFITIIYLKVTMPFWSQNPQAFAYIHTKIHQKSIKPPLKPLEASLSIHPKLWSNRQSYQQGKIIWESLSMAHIPNMVFSLVSHEVMFC